MTSNVDLLGFAKYVEQRVVQSDTFKVPRFVLGPTAHCFMLWHLAETFDTSGKTTKALSDLIASQAPDGDVKDKEHLAVVVGPGQNNVPFRYTHFLPNPIRTHYVLSGSGRLQCQDTGFDMQYKSTDSFVVPSACLNKLMLTTEVTGYSIHVVTLWANSGAVWEDYAVNNVH